MASGAPHCPTGLPGPNPASQIHVGGPGPIPCPDRGVCQFNAHPPKLRWDRLGGNWGSELLPVGYPTLAGALIASPPPRPAGARWSAPLISPYLPKPLANVTLMELKSTRFVLLQLSPNPPPLLTPPPSRFPLFWKYRREGVWLLPRGGGQPMGTRVRAAGRAPPPPPPGD